jgi:hypothetical protein
MKYSFKDMKFLKIPFNGNSFLLIAKQMLGQE